MTIDRGLTPQQLRRRRYQKLRDAIRNVIACLRGPLPCAEDRDSLNAELKRLLGMRRVA
jgi:hypothetical protein